MSKPCVKVQTIGRVALWIISNEGAKNALSPEMYIQGTDAVQTFVNDPNLGAAVLCGENGFFCAGGNLNRLQNNRALDPSVQNASIETLHHWVQAIHNSPKPIIAAVDGAAAGAGFSLALAADMIVASESAKFVMAYINVGLTPDGGASWALPKRVPANLAFEWLALGQPVPAQRLFEAGVVNLLAPCAAQPCATNQTPAVLAALELASRLSLGPSRAVTSIKQLIEASRSNNLATHLDAERALFVEQLHSIEAGIGIAAFLAKSKAKFHP